MYGEKPLTSDMITARTLTDQAGERGVAVGCAPDTVLGTGVQTARAAVDSGSSAVRCPRQYGRL